MRGYLGRYGDLGIGVLDVDGADLAERPGIEIHNPSYLALAPDGGTLYAVLERPEGGRVAAFAVDGDGLRALGSQPTGGTSPCHLSVHPTGRYVLTANYASGSVAVHRIHDDGSLGERTDLVHHAGSGPVRDRQEGPHAHMVVTEPSGRYVLAVDLGTDTVYRYRLDAETGRLIAHGEMTLPAGTGPRHLTFHPDGRRAYLAGELDSTVRVLEPEVLAVGHPVSTVPAGVAVANLPSAIRVSADGRFCYVANRGHDSISVLVIDEGPADLQLATTVPCGGEHPRDLVLTGEWLYVANQSSGSVTSFRVDPTTGVPTATGISLETPSPSCILLP